ncbi:hypothetical protein M0Q50_01150 [bacterium]|jgi:hypothetical protein|nr:hypothetical protein [bacterium]
MINTKKLTTEYFVKKSMIIHNNKYDYSLVEYINSETKVKIICPIHGIFEQSPYCHLINKGCLQCLYDSKKTTLDEFTKKSMIIHNNKYDYSLVEYINARIKVKIICPIHGIFEQSPYCHLINKGCPMCSGNKKLTKEKFEEKSNIIHNNYFDYSLVIYINNSTKVKIICPEHGIFEQKPSNHLNGKKCTLCANINRRLKLIKRLEENKLNGHQLVPNFNKDACKLFDDISLKEGIHIQHAMNGGEFYIKELGYWVDGYDKENNIVYEFDEKHHNNKLEKDLIRQIEIQNKLDCKFIRIEEKK